MLTGPSAPFEPGSLWLGVHDALSARIARDARVAGLWLSSYGVSASLQANPDASLVTSSEMLTVARAVCRAAGQMPIIVDCDTGYGDATVFAAVVEAYAATSRVAALCLEDKVFPKRNTLAANGLTDLEPSDLFEAKLRAGLRARNATRPSLRIIARSEALALGAGIDETVRRLDRYARMGADAVLVQSKGPIDEMVAVATNWNIEARVPLICVPTSYPGIPAATWWRYGFDVVVRSHQLLQANIAAQLELLNRIASSELAPTSYASRLADHEVIGRLVASDLPKLVDVPEKRGDSDVS